MKLISIPERNRFEGNENGIKLTRMKLMDQSKIGHNLRTNLIELSILIYWYHIFNSLGCVVLDFFSNQYEQKCKEM